MVAETLEQATKMGAPRAVALCKNFGGYLDFQAGEWDLAEESLRSAVQTYHDCAASSGESLTLQRLGVVLTAKGRFDEAAKFLDEGIVVAERAVMRSHALTRIYSSIARNCLAAGDLDGAVRALEQGQAEAQRHGNCVTCNGLLLPESVRVHLAAGRHDAAQEATEKLEAIAETYGSSLWSAMARHARGRYLLATGQSESAEAALQAAEDAYAAHGEVYEAARCRIARSLAIEDAARRTEVATPARETLRRLGVEHVEGETSQFV
jgi:ATP/maltotriose-dependent transcriptional regulator MalT